VILLIYWLHACKNDLVCLYKGSVAHCCGVLLTYV